MADNFFPTSEVVQGVGSGQAAAAPNPISQTGTFRVGRGEDTRFLESVKPQKMDTSTMDALVGLAGQALEPAIVKTQNELFVKGVLAAKNRDTLQQLGSDAWPATIFGKGSTLRGAMLVKSQQGVTDMAIDVQRNMEDLKTLPTSQFQAHLAKMAEGLLTGDADTDAVTAAKLVEVFPRLVQEQAQQFAVYEQNTMKEASLGLASADMDSGILRLDQLHKTIKTEGTTKEATQALLAQQTDFEDKTVAGMFIFPAGMTAESRATHTKDIISLAIQKNDAGTIAAVFRKPEQYLKDLSPADRQTVYAQRAAFEVKRRQTFAGLEMLGFVTDLMESAQYGDVSAAQVAEATTAINDYWHKMYRMDGDYIDNDGLSSLIMGTYARDNARRNAAASAAAASTDKFDKNANKLIEINDALSHGDYQKAVQNGQDDTDAIVLNNFQRLFEEDPKLAVNTLTLYTTNNRGTPISRVAAHLQTQPRQVFAPEGLWTPQADDMVTRFDAINEANPTTAAAYYGDTYLALSEYSRFRKMPGLDKVGAFNLAKQAYQTSTTYDKAPPDVVQAVTERLKVDTHPGYTSLRFFPGKYAQNTPMTARGAAELGRRLAPKVAAGMRATGQTAEFVLNNVGADSSVDVAGGVVFDLRPNEVPLGHLAGLSSASVDRDLPNLAMFKLRKALGKETGTLADQYNKYGNTKAHLWRNAWQAANSGETNNRSILAEARDDADGFRVLGQFRDTAVDPVTKTPQVRVHVVFIRASDSKSVTTTIWQRELNDADVAYRKHRQILWSE